MQAQILTKKVECMELKAISLFLLYQFLSFFTDHCDSLTVVEVQCLISVVLLRVLRLAKNINLKSSSHIHQCYKIKRHYFTIKKSSQSLRQFHLIRILFL